MKTLVTLIMLCALWLNVHAQAPQKMSYQAVVRNTGGNLVKGQAVGMKVSILKGSDSGSVIFSETYTPAPQTNENGLVSIEIGSGTPVTGTFTGINWADGPFWLRTETDPSGGTDYSVTGTSPLLSVPYALYAKDVQNKDDADADPTNEIQVLSLTGNNLTLSRNGGTVTLPGDGWGSQVVVTDGTLTGKGTTALPLKIPDNAITTAKIANSTIVAADLANSAVTTDKIYDASVTGAKMAQAGATTGQVLKWTGSVWAPGNDLSGGDLWSQNGANISYNTGNVGIGTTTPAGFLHVSANTDYLVPQLLLTEKENDYARLMFKNTIVPSKSWTFSGYLNATDASSLLHLYYWNGTSGGNYLTVKGNGNVGIGTSNPASTLHVNGTAQINGILYMENHKISNVSDPVNLQDAATKTFVEKMLKDLGQIPNNYAGTMKDIEGNVYKTVQIGSQVWMAENLRTGKYKDGTAIPLVTDNTAWGNLTTPGYCWYNNDHTTYGAVYGALYNWYAVNTGKLCPTSWHVPSDAEWTTLTTFLGGESVAGGKMKEAGTAHWQSPNTGATNESGFSCLPGGDRGFSGPFNVIGRNGSWWSSTESSTNYAWYRLLGDLYTNVYRYGISKGYGFSVRCLRD